MKTLLLLLTLSILFAGCRKQTATTFPETIYSKESKTIIIYPKYIVRPFGYDLTKTHIDFMKPGTDGC